MAVKIRLERMGTKDRPYYRVVVKPERSKQGGKAIEILGYYHPIFKPPKVKVDKKRVEYWISHGAQPTSIVRHILKI